METVILCFLCRNDTVKENLEFYNVQSSVVPMSQKPIHVVLQHLANCIKYKLIFQTDTYICEDCFRQMSHYDSLMLNLLSSQKRLTCLLQNALLEKPFEEEGIGEPAQTPGDINEDSVNIEFEEAEEDPSLVDAFNPNLDTKEELIEINDDSFIEEETEESNAESIDVYSSKIDSNYSRLQDSVYSKAERKRQGLECVVCGAVLKSKFLLQTHMHETHNVKQFTCKICGISKKDEEYLELHMNIHEGKTENECRYCPKRFTRPVNTLRHMRIHWDKKKFQCEKCGERFSLDNMLYNHRLRHEAEENPLICAICNQSFKSRKTYTHHLLIHQENRPRHYCHFCPKSFTERYTLKMHLKTHWGGVTPTAISKSTVYSKSSPEEKETDSEETIAILMEGDNFDSDSMCDIYNKKYDTQDNAQKHLEDVHDVILN